MWLKGNFRQPFSNIKDSLKMYVHLLGLHMVCILRPVSNLPLFTRVHSLGISSVGINFNVLMSKTHP